MFDRLLKRKPRYKKIHRSFKLDKENRLFLYSTIADLQYLVRELYSQPTRLPGKYSELLLTLVRGLKAPITEKKLKGLFVQLETLHMNGRGENPTEQQLLSQVIMLLAYVHHKLFSEYIFMTNHKVYSMTEDMDALAVRQRVYDTLTTGPGVRFLSGYGEVNILSLFIMSTHLHNTTFTSIEEELTNFLSLSHEMVPLLLGEEVLEAVLLEIDKIYKMQKMHIIPEVRDAYRSMIARIIQVEKDSLENKTSPCILPWGLQEIINTQLKLFLSISDNFDLFIKLSKLVNGLAEEGTTKEQMVHVIKTIDKAAMGESYAQIVLQPIVQALLQYLGCTVIPMRFIPKRVKKVTPIIKMVSIFKFMAEPNSDIFYIMGKYTLCHMIEVCASRIHLHHHNIKLTTEFVEVVKEFSGTVLLKEFADTILIEAGEI